MAKSGNGQNSRDEQVRSRPVTCGGHGVIMIYEHLLRQPSWKGELDGDVELDRGERSAGLVTGQAGADRQRPHVRCPAKPGQPGGTLQMSSRPSRDRLVHSVLR